MYEIRRLGAAAIVGCLTLLAFSSPAMAATSQTVSGTFAEPAPPVVTAYDPKTGAISDDGVSIWTGTWTGTTYWTSSGTINLLTGDSKGTIDETFTGRSEAGGSGTLHFTETYTIDGAADTIHIVATLLSGTGDFAGSRGNVTFNGLELPSGQGEGTYTGTWVRGLAAPAGGHPQPPPSNHISPATAPRLRVIVSPRRVKAERTQRFAFRVTARRRPVAHAWVVLDGHRTQTDHTGRATLVIALPHVGRYRVTVLHTGMALATAFVRARPNNNPPDGRTSK